MKLRTAFGIDDQAQVEFKYKDRYGDIITVSDFEGICDALRSQDCKKMEVIVDNATSSALDSAIRNDTSSSHSPISFSPTVKGNSPDTPITAAEVEMKEAGVNASTTTQASHTQTSSPTSVYQSAQTEPETASVAAATDDKHVDSASLIEDIKEKVFKSFDTKSLAEDLTGRIWGLLQKHTPQLDSAARMLAAATDPDAGVSASEIRSQLSVDTAAANGSSSKSEDVVTHSGVYCDGPNCDQLIRGARYKCVSGCFNFDLCERCEARNIHTDKHTPDHTLLKIKRPKSIPIDAFIIPKSKRSASLSPSVLPTVHKFCFCDVCDQAIVGTRWKCGMCINFDVCTDCLSKIDRKHISHADEHCFIRITRPIQKFVSESIPLLPPFYDGSMSFATIDHKQPTVAEGGPTQTHAVENSTVFPHVPVTPPSLKNMRRTSRIASEMFSPTTAPTPPTDVSDNIYKAGFVDDVSYPDGTLVQPGTELEKVWSFTNCGDADWPEDVQLIRVGGHKSVYVDPVQKPVPTAKAGETVNIGVKVRVPSVEGRYITYFRLVTNDGRRFGHRVWLDLMVDDDADNQDEIMATSSMIFPKLKFGNDNVEKQSERGAVSIIGSAKGTSRAPSVMTEDPFSDATSAMSLPGDISEDVESIADTKTVSTFSRRSSFASEHGSDFVVVEGENDNEEDFSIEMEYHIDNVVDEQADEAREGMVVDAVEFMSGNSAFEDEDASSEHRSMYFNAEVSHDQEAALTNEPVPTYAAPAAAATEQEHFMPGAFRQTEPTTPERLIVHPAIPESPSAFELKMTALAEMGFTDRDFNSELLQVHDGDLEGVISDLLGNPAR